MDSFRFIDIKEAILSDNRDLANQIRAQLLSESIFMLNLMSAPGSGKTSLIVETIRRMRDNFHIGVIEGDIESCVDSEKILAEGIHVVQLRTGGACHLDAPMIDNALQTLNLDEFNFIIIENVGNLVCPAEFDTGALRKAMILSIPEGDDKVLKYPFMFSVCDALVVNKMDYLNFSDFNLTNLKKQVQNLNPYIQIFETSCRTGEGIDEWCQWLKNEMLINGFAKGDDMEKLCNKLFDLAKPYLSVRSNQEHSEASFSFAKELQKQLGGSKRIIYPAIILHDVGWSAVSEELHLKAFGPKEVDLKINRIHEVEGAKIAKKLLQVVPMDNKEREEICRIIQNHDSGDSPLTLEEKIVKDSDKLFRFSPRGFAIDAERFGINPREYWQILNDFKEQWFFNELGKTFAIRELEKVKIQVLKQV